MDRKAFARRVRYGLVDLDISRKELAKRLGTTPAMITRWLSGAHEPRISLIEKMGKLFKTHPAVLMYGDEVTIATTTKRKAVN